jgi:dTDP-4-dehydrorhamnose reductase
MKIMLVGADGQLGSDIATNYHNKPGIEFIPVTIRDMDITDSAQSASIIKSCKPDVLINTAAYIQVDQSEIEVETAFKVNTYTQKHLTSLCKDLDILYVFLSTDYVFDGAKQSPYTEDDNPNPINLYGVTKLAAEHIIRYSLDRHLILRVTGLYGVNGPMGKRGNFVDLIVEKAQKGETIRVVDDQRLTPTATIDVAKSLDDLIQSNATGLFHLTNEGDCTWFEFAQEILRVVGIQTSLVPAKTGDFGELARRPRYSVLENKHLKSMGLKNMPHWKDALELYLKSKFVNLKQQA